MPYEIPKWAVDGATVLAFVFAALPYLVSPEATNKALPRFIKRFRGWIAAAALVVFMWLLHRQPFMHARMPVWGAMDGAVILSVLFFAFLGLIDRKIGLKDEAARLGSQTQSRLMIPNFIDMAGMRWPVYNKIVRADPVCATCNKELVHLKGNYGGFLGWKCHDCGKEYHWDFSKGQPQDAAAEMVNCKFRSNNQHAPLTGQDRKL